jgi:hypothetical protein
VERTVAGRVSPVVALSKQRDESPHLVPLPSVDGPRDVDVPSVSIGGVERGWLSHVVRPSAGGSGASPEFPLSSSGWGVAAPGIRARKHRFSPPNGPAGRPPRTS